MEDGVHAARTYVTRATRRLADLGVRQFLDIGSGLPMSPNVHETAQQVDPECRVVYVDNDPTVLAHARALLPDGKGPNPVHVLDGDMHDPAQILGEVEANGWLDPGQPVAVLLLAVLHFIPGNADAARIVAGFTSRLAPGSHVAISHVSAEDDERGAATRRAAAIYTETTALFRARTIDEIQDLFTPHTLLPPGVRLLRHHRRVTAVAAGIART